MKQHGTTSSLRGELSAKRERCDRSLSLAAAIDARQCLNMTSCGILWTTVRRANKQPDGWLACGALTAERSTTMMAMDVRSSWSTLRLPSRAWSSREVYQHNTAARSRFLANNVHVRKTHRCEARCRVFAGLSASAQIKLAAPPWHKLVRRSKWQGSTCPN